MWIGAKTSDGSSEWTWDDGTVFNYTNWAGNASLGNEGLCSYLHWNNNWHDAPCGTDGASWKNPYYMCKKQPGMF